MSGVGEAEPVGTGFTYQGRLLEDSNAPTDLYDMQFKLFNSVSEEDQIGVDVNKPDVNVIDGYFTVVLDFNDFAFDGNSRWLQVGVRYGELEEPNIYTELSPRQEVTAAPYAQYALSAEYVSMPIALSGSGTVPVISGTSTGDGLAVYGLHDVSGNEGYIGGDSYGVYGMNLGSGNEGYIGGDSYGVFGQSDSGTGVYGQSTSGYAGYFDGDTTTTGDLIVDANVGIGTSSPTERLHLSDTGSVGLLIEADTDNSGEGDQPSITLSQDGGIVEGKIGFFGSENKLSIYNTYGDDLKLGTNNDSNMVVIKPYGNVGIGTDSPKGLFEVWGQSGGPGTLDQQQTTQNLAIVASDQWQSFTPGVSGFLTKLELRISAVQDFPAILRIYEGEGTAGTLLTTQSITVTYVWNVWKTYTFYSPALLESGNQYTFRITALSEIEFLLEGADTDNYPGGRWNDSESTNDCLFKTYMAPPLYQSILITDIFGYVGIGTTSPTQKLDVSGNAAISGSVGIGTTSPSAKLDVIGNIRTVGIYEVGLGENWTARESYRAWYSVAMSADGTKQTAVVFGG
jgi:hypothetical protein